MKKLGDEIKFNSQIERINAKWEEFHFDKPKKGIVIGIRTLSNGFIEKEYDDWNHHRVVNKIYIPKEHFKAYLVVYNIYRKPVYVKITDENFSRTS